ncbi:MAG: hypothetical protein WDW36_004757 [Sanguina aurantia]
MPGFSGQLPSRTFSGYVTVGQEASRHLFYLWMESQLGLEDSPVVLWLSGGPGCSGLDAYFYEHGPFLFSEADSGSSSMSGAAGPGKAAQDIVASANPNSWSTIATMIYVDSPAGTGFSYSTNPAVDYHSNDQVTTNDLVDLVDGLFRRYPQLADRDFYISGESYGGIYVPMLARKLLERKVAPRLKGYLIGNGVGDDVIDGNAQMEFAHAKDIIDTPTFRSLQRACNSMFWNASTGSRCSDIIEDVTADLWRLNWYNVLGECVKVPSTEESLVSESQGAVRFPPVGVFRSVWQQRGVALELRQQGKQQQRQVLAAAGGASSLSNLHPRLQHVVPCADRRLAMLYFNAPAVRAALGVAPQGPPRWEPCSDVLNYALDTAAMQPWHLDLQDMGMQALLYSGDHDMVVPFTGTRKWVDAMGLKQLQPYKPWFIDHQIVGFQTRYQPHLFLATVKGAGHMAPTTHPAQTLELITRFINSEL